MGYGWEKKMNGTKKIGDWHIRAIAGLSRKKDKKHTLRTRAGLLPASTIRTTYQKPVVQRGC